MKWSVFGSLGENDFFSPGKFMLYRLPIQSLKKDSRLCTSVARSSTKIIFGF